MSVARNTGGFMSLKEIRELLTVQETAEILQCHPDNVTALVKRGKLKVVRLGRAVRVVSDSIHALTNKEVQQ